jgi:hypothetical protein
MSHDNTSNNHKPHQHPQLKELAAVCRRLVEARRAATELEAQRDALICQLRADGVSGALLAEHSGLSAGRVTQIVSNVPVD